MNPQSSKPASAAAASAASTENVRFFYQPPPADVEMSAYALLSYMIGGTGDTKRALPIVRWLTAQRNPAGGFSSTQDTVVGLQALGSFAERAYATNFNMELSVQSGAERFVAPRFLPFMLIIRLLRIYNFQAQFLAKCRQFNCSSKLRGEQSDDNSLN